MLYSLRIIIYRECVKEVDNDKNSNELKRILDVLETRTFKFIFFFICIGVLLIFMASILNTEENKYYEIANAMNMFISIVVGIVAMVMSIISLFFSFYNTKQSYETNDIYLEKFINITNSLNQSLEKQREYIDYINQLSEKLSSVDDKMSTKFEKIYDKLNEIDKGNFNRLQPSSPRWKDLEESDWDFYPDEENDE